MLLQSLFIENLTTFSCKRHVKEFFYYLAFVLGTFMIHRTVGEEGGYQFYRQSLRVFLRVPDLHTLREQNICGFRN